MAMILEEADYKAVRNFLRFSAMGVMPSQERANAALDVVKASGPENLVRVREVAEGVRKGVLSEQGACLDACREIERAWGHVEASNERSSPGFGRRG